MTDRPSENAHALGSLRLADGKGIVHIELRFDSSIDDVWSALIEPERLAGWLGKFEGHLRRGGSFRARFFASEWEGTGRINVCEPPRHLVVSTTEAGARDVHVMELTMSAKGDQTVLVFEERGVPRGQLAAYGAGNQIHLEDLAAYLTGSERCDARVRWKELMPAYSGLTLDLA
ncbi:MAG: SRPBCC domain-containing protein [Pseudomonadota bacterium]|nr:SRPBCC domain-containing protein [Pseudomonadota bacterium]